MSTFIYIQTVDCGLAPCVHYGTWSLALCKPAIRRKAAKGDVIIAVTPVQDGHRLSSWARVKDQITTTQFYGSFPPSRPDNIYEPIHGGKFKRHSLVRHDLHSGIHDQVHDLGRANQNAKVLIAKDFFSFGQDALPLIEWTRGRPHLKRVVNGLLRATRRYFEEGVETDLKNLEVYLRTAHAQRQCKSFKPREPKLRLSCGQENEEKGYSVCLLKKARK